MSVAHLKARDKWTEATFGGQSATCFFCAEEIDAVAILWNGCTGLEMDDGLIALHPDCAALLGGELIGDARNAKRLLENKSLLAGVDRSLLPQGEA